MEYIDRIFYRKINPSDFKKLYDIDRPAGGGGQTYLEAAGISNDDIVDFLSYAEISDSTLPEEERSVYSFNAHVLGNAVTSAFIEFAPRGNRANYRISRQNLRYKHPAWKVENGFPEPHRNGDGEYTSEGNFVGIIDFLVIMIIRTTYKKYYAGYLNANLIPDEWPQGIGLESMFEGERRGVLRIENCSVAFRDSLENPFGQVFDTPLVEQQENDKKPSSKLSFKSGFDSSFPRNRIVFGAPGTGKSFKLNMDKDTLLEDLPEDERKKCYERVTFHPDYSYAQFVGTYKPVMVKNSQASTRDAEVDYVLKILKDDKTTAQNKYEVLLEYFQNKGKSAIYSRLPALLGLYTDEKFLAYTENGIGTSSDYSNEKKIGKDLRKYVTLLDNKYENGGEIAYEYVPGPFMRVYVNAMKSVRDGSRKPFLLIIEEINRANVAAVFGDVFQLLDRKNNVSEYPIQASEDMKKYLSKELDCSLEECSEIQIPDNMFIWATMNSADQGVFPMDTAFKRRWDFKYLGIDANEKDLIGKYVVLGSENPQKIIWNELRKAINYFLAKKNINEDKQLGPYFIARRVVVPENGGNEINSQDFCDAFRNKVLMYLFEDAARQKRPELFGGLTRFSEILDKFDKQGIEIFPDDIKTNPNIFYKEPANTSTDNIIADSEE